MRVICLWVFASCLVSACHSTPTPSAAPAAGTLEAARQAIEASNITYWQAFAQADSSLFINRYAPDACIMPGNTPALCGPGAAATFYRIAYHQVGVRNGKFTLEEVWGGGDFVTEKGRYELRGANDAPMGDGKYLVLWKKMPHGWKMFRDSFSSDQAVTVQQPTR